MIASTIILESEEQLSSVARLLEEYSTHSKIVCLEGEMGSGKTTLVKRFCTHLQVLDDVTSPTFSLIQEYRTEAEQKIYHLDLYRIDTQDQLFEIGVSELLESNDWVFIEWPALVQHWLPDKFIWVEIVRLEEGQRKIVISRLG